MARFSADSTSRIIRTARIGRTTGVTRAAALRRMNIDIVLINGAVLMLQTHKSYAE